MCRQSPTSTPAGKKHRTHEAIRPTSILRLPSEVEPYLNRDQQRLYTLIWQRFAACQMTAAVYDTVSAQIEAGDYGVVRGCFISILFLRGIHAKPFTLRKRLAMAR